MGNILDRAGKEKEDSFYFDMISSFFDNRKQETSVMQYIDKEIINDIDFEELFMYLDRTSSNVGQQYLYKKLLSINKNVDFSGQEKTIAFLQENSSVRQKTIQVLSRLSKRESYYLPGLIYERYIQKPKWFWVIRILSFLSFAVVLSTLLLKLTLWVIVLLTLLNVVFHYWNKSNIFMYAESIPQLLLLIRCAEELQKMDIPVKNDKVAASINSVRSLKKNMRIFRMDYTSNTSEIQSFFLLIIEYLKILFLLEPILVFNTLEKIDKKRSDIECIFNYVGEIDSALSIYFFRKSIPCYCLPVFVEKQKEITCTDVYHPLVDGCVSNSLSVREKSVLLTGSNMSGKTTFIRTIAINVLLAQTMNTCFAHSFLLSPTRIYSAIRISDDLLSMKSYYFEEVRIIKNMILESHSDRMNLFLLDEIFRGTNTLERISAGKAVLSYLNSKNNIVFVSTHDIELADLLEEEYSLCHFTEIVKDDSVCFDYKLKQGRLLNKNAIRILEINNYPPEVVEEARNISELLIEKQIRL